MTKEIKTWTVFKNTNNTLEGIEAITFAIRQVALDEIEKESDHIVFMSNTIVNLIISNNNRLVQENKELKELKCKFKEYCTCDTEEYRSALEEINILVKNYCNACDEFKAKTYKNKNDCLYCNYGFIKRKINEVLK